jgi:alpha-amylase
MMQEMMYRARTAAAGLMLALMTGACADGTGPSVPRSEPDVQRPTLPTDYRPAGHAAAGDVFVHLFEWKWTDVAEECETVLGPAGYKAVQVSPPQEHLMQPEAPWWQRYQPVSYSLTRTRSGTGAQFTEMVARCRAAGVDVYVDAVINHMTAGSGVGSSGTAHTKYNYPGLYTQADFHAPCAVTDYTSAVNVQDCELLGLADLNTGSPTVQQKIADYLTALARMGVAGFRIDAAKHIQPVELDAILDRVNQALAAEGRPLPYWFAEVIDNGGEAVKREHYYGLAYGTGGAADVTEFRYKGVGDKFLGGNGQRLADLRTFGPATWNLMPSDKAVVFLENHDTQRYSGIGYRDGVAFRLANVWMMAQPYGYPSVMSSYGFDRTTAAGRDAGPPSAGVTTTDVECAATLEAATVGAWVCEHRDPTIVRMVGFRRAMAGTDLNRWWDNGANAIAFSRGDRGFVAISRESSVRMAAVPSGLPGGTYCDILTGGKVGNACAGNSVTVAEGGVVQLSIIENSALVIHTGTRL